MRLAAWVKGVTKFSLLALPFVLTACGASGPTKFKVTGNISLDGQPVEQGTVIFYPTEKGGGDADVATIQHGAYTMNAKAGDKRVEITAQRKIVPEKIGMYGDPEMEQYIPAQFNRQTKLEAKVATNNNVIDFKLETGKK